MKIYCEVCGGSGKTTTRQSLGQGVRGIGHCVTSVCGYCGGLGYTERTATIKKRGYASSYDYECSECVTGIDDDYNYCPACGAKFTEVSE